jgi:putative oxidoreductase
MAWLTILVELLGGFAVLLGAFVVPLSVPMAAVLLVAAFTVHLPFGFTSIKLLAITSSGPQFGPPGYETDLLYLACLAALVMGGSGPWAADSEIGRWLRGTPKKSGGSVAARAEAGRADR